jgi:hypothetical protein
MSVGMYCPSQPWICSGTTAFEAVLPRHPPAPDSLAICVASVAMPRPGRFVGDARTIAVLPCVATDSRLMVVGALPSRVAPSTSIHRLSEHVRSLLASARVSAFALRRWSGGRRLPVFGKMGLERSVRSVNKQANLVKVTCPLLPCHS